MGKDVKLNIQFVKQPRYYNNFACIGADCPQNCCFGWGDISWSNDEVDKLKSADCSEELRKLIDETFVPGGVKDYYTVKFGENGFCPLQDENGWCRVQKELGAEYLSKPCMIYPRRAFCSGNTMFNFCYMSCYHILDTLCNDRDCMKLETHMYKKGEPFNGFFNISSSDLINHPELRYHRQIFDFYYEIISDESQSVETSVILGSMAAHKITEFIDQKLYDRIPELINAVRPQLKGYIKAIDKVDVNYVYKIQFAGALCIQILNNTLLFSGIAAEDGKGVDLNKYLEGERRFKEAFADRPFVFRNIALNLLMECQMPFRNKELSLFDNYRYYIAALAAMRIVAPAIYMLEGDSEMGFKQMVAYMARSFTHNDAKVMEIINFSNAFGCTDHSHITALLKN